MLAFPQRQRSDGFLGRVSVSVWIQITLQREKQRNKNILKSWNLHATVVLEEASKQELNHNSLVEIYVKN